VVNDSLVNALRDELRRYLLEVLPDDSSGELQQLPLTELVIIYLTWRGRFISAHPRRVLVSAELQASDLGADQQGFARLVEKIERGTDLTPHLSKSVTTAYLPSTVAATKKTHQLRDRDQMISEWGIHHLHLGTEVAANGRVGRTPRLLFGYFADDVPT
jgi:hypothetical protein